MLASAVAGYADYSTTDGRARVRATVHSSLMLVALVRLPRLARRSGRGHRPTGRCRSRCRSWRYLILVGGRVRRAATSCSRSATWSTATPGGRPGTKWQPLEVGDDPRGRAGQGQARHPEPGPDPDQGDTILALHDQCAHAGGPLSDGRHRRRLRSSAPGTAPGSSSRPVDGGAARRSTTSRPTRSARPRRAATRRAGAPEPQASVSGLDGQAPAARAAARSAGVGAGGIGGSARGRSARASASRRPP